MAFSEWFHLWSNVHCALIVMTHFTVIIALCISKLDGLHLMIFMYNALLLKLPNYLMSPLSFKSCTTSSNYLTLDIPHTH